MAEFIVFEKGYQLEGRKTERWLVRAKSNGVVLGEIKWLGRWRQYCFFPLHSTVFSRGCMYDINAQIDHLMDERKFVTGPDGEEVSSSQAKDKYDDNEPSHSH